MGHIYIDNRGGSSGNWFCGMLSLAIPGLGQFLLGRWLRAFAHFVFAVALWVVLLGWVIHIYSAVEASR